MRPGLLLACMAVWGAGHAMAAGEQARDSMNNPDRLVTYNEAFTLQRGQIARLPDGTEMILLGFGHKIVGPNSPPPPVIATLRFRSHGVVEEKTFNIPVDRREPPRIVHGTHVFIVEDARFNIGLRLRLIRKKEAPDA